MLIQNEKLQLIGLTALAISEREQLTRTEAAIQKFFEGHGISKDDAYTWAGELAYNQGDYPITAVDNIMRILKLEVEE